MRTAILCTIIATLVLASCGSAFALAGEYGTRHPIVQQPEWPAGLADFLKAHNPAYAYWVNSTDYFLYKGDARAFNAFLEDYAGLRGVPLTLVLHAAPGKVKRLSSGKPEIAFDWSVFVAPPMIPDGGIDKTSPYKRYVTVNLWLGGSGIELKDIKVPPNVKVVPGKEISEFISSHDKARGETFGIYLFKDDKIDAMSALKLKQARQALQDKPLLSIDDFVWYRWSDHTFELESGAAARLPKVGPGSRLVTGIPFVVMIGDRIAYQGAFISTFSSMAFPAPVIVVDFPRPQDPKNVYSMDRAYPGTWPDLPKEDPRENADVKAAFEKAGKLR